MGSILTESQKTREFVAALKLLSPGTPLREGIDYVIQAKMGGLICVGDTPEVLDLTEGGFRINWPIHADPPIRIVKNGWSHYSL